MGIRIHRALGYAGYHPEPDKLNDLIWENQQDNQVVALIDAEYQRLCDNGKKISRTTRLLGADTTLGFASLGSKPPRYFSDIVHYADHPDESGSPFVIVPPPYHKKWYRYDDMIDYMDAYQLQADDPCISLHKWFYTPLYPYINWMNKNTGEIEHNYDRIRKEFDPNMVPAVPKSVQVIAAHLGFNWLELRPMLATWWC
jgi:hypothetical protein